MAGFHLCPVWEAPAPGEANSPCAWSPAWPSAPATTPPPASALNFLRQVYEADTPRRVLDLGTGTGILSLASLALGAERVMAVEYNELAVRTAARNFRQTASGRGHLIQGDARDSPTCPAAWPWPTFIWTCWWTSWISPHFLNKDWYIFSGILGAQLEVFP